MADLRFVRQHLDHLERLAGQFTDLADTTAGQYRTVKNDQRLTDEGKRERRVEIKRGFHEQFAKLRGDFADTRDSADRAIDRADREYTGAGSDDAALAIRHASAWDRARRMLAGGVGYGDTIAALHGDQDVAALQAMLVEAPSWLRAQRAGARRPGLDADTATLGNGSDLNRARELAADALIDLLPTTETEVFRARRRYAEAVEQGEAAASFALAAAAGAEAGAARIRQAYGATGTNRVL